MVTWEALKNMTIVVNTIMLILMITVALITAFKMIISALWRRYRPIGFRLVYVVGFILGFIVMIMALAS